MNIDCEAETMGMIKQIGQHHAILNQTCGFQANIWEQLGEIAVEKICNCDAVQVSPSHCFICFIFTFRKPAKPAEPGEH